MPIIWWMVPEIWSATDRIFIHFGPFFPFTPPSPNDPENQNFEKMKKMPGDTIMCTIITIMWCMYGSWDIERNKNFCHFGPFFALLPHPPPSNPKNLEKIWKKHGDIIILHKCSKNHNHMLHCSWDTARDGCNFCSSLRTIFCPFTP